MTDKILEQILAELQAIRAALNARPQSPPSPAKTYAANATQPTPGAPAVIPQPGEVIADAGDVKVHFGKNKGTAISQLGERSLEWYATSKPAKTDSSGKPYPQRAEDAYLENAARTLWHQKRGTLAGPAKPMRLESAEAMAGEGGEDNVPF